MADVQLSSAFPLPDSDNELKSWTYLASVISNIVLSNITQSDVLQGLESLVAIGDSSPSGAFQGRMWLDTSGATFQLKFWSGSDWVGIVAWGDTMPASTMNTLWFDTTLQLLRMYSTIGVVTGWHPVSASYQLMTNEENADIGANLVVSRAGGTLNIPGFVLPVGTKDMSVVGVTAEAILDGATGVVAVVDGGGAVLRVTVDETDGGVAQGDLLVVYEEAGSARTVGQLLTPIGTSREVSRGVPAGAFATALGLIDGNGMVICRMLGAIGGGAFVSVDPITAATLVDDTVWHDFPLASTIINSKHSPILSATMSFQLQLNTTTADNGDFRIGDSSLASTPGTWKQFLIWDNASVNAQEQETFSLEIPTHSNVDPTTFPGDWFTYMLDTTGGVVWNTRSMTIIGYRY